jgi:glycosyltransferase involved in cell wall biosynthesis
LMKLSSPIQWEKLKVAPLGIDSELFKPAGFRPNPRPFEILCVGRLVPTKAQHVLLASLDRLCRSGRDVRLRLVGSGPDRESLEKEVKCRGLASRVRFEGNVNQDRIRDIYASADAFVLASSAEGVPVVLMEAMAMEIPCVATHVCGIPELIRNEVDGLLVAPSDEHGLADAIARLMDDPHLRRRLGCAGRQRVAEKYELSRNVTRLAELFRTHATPGIESTV